MPEAVAAVQGWDVQFEEIDEIPQEKRWYLYKPIDSSKGIRFENEHDAAYYSMNEFLEKLRRRRRKESTLKSYTNIIRSAIDKLVDGNHHSDPHRIDEKGIQYLIANLDISENSLHHYFAVLQIWTAAEHGNEVIRDMKLKWNHNECPNAIELDHDDFMRLWSIVDDPSDRMILTLGGRCGMRRNEMYQLKVSDITPTEIRITGKGHNKGKMRSFPLTQGVSEEIERYMHERERIIRSGKRDYSEGYLLVTLHHNDVTHMSYVTIGDRIRSLSKRTGISMTPHSLRRHHATYVSEDATLDLMISICKTMGWSSFDMFLRYISSNKKKLKNIMEEKEKQYISMR